MFDTLIESRRTKNRRRGFGLSAMSLVIHTVVIGAAVYATLNAGQNDNPVKVDTAMVFVDQPKQEKPPEQQPVQLDVPPGAKICVSTEWEIRAEDYVLFERDGHFGAPASLAWLPIDRAPV